MLGSQFVHLQIAEQTAVSTNPTNINPNHNPANLIYSSQSIAWL